MLSPTRPCYLTLPTGIDIFFVRESPKYHLMEPLVRQGWNARVVGAFYAHIASSGLLHGYNPEDREWNRVGAFDAAIEELSPAQVVCLLDQVQDSMFTSSVWSGNDETNKEYVSQCRLVQEGELFLLLRHAIKHGDIGWTRELVPQLSVLFYGSEQFNYGYEMIFLSCLLTDAVCEPTLQRMRCFLLL